MSRIITLGAAQLGPIQRRDRRVSAVERMLELMRLAAEHDGAASCSGAWRAQAQPRAACAALASSGLSKLILATLPTAHANGGAGCPHAWQRIGKRAATPVPAGLRERLPSPARGLSLP